MISELRQKSCYLLSRGTRLLAQCEQGGCPENVETNPGAVGFVPVNLLSDKATTIKTEPIGRSIYLFCVGKPSPNLQKLIDFIRNEGPKYGLTKVGI